MSRMTLAVHEEALPPGLSWRQKLEAAGRAGFDAMELSIGEDDDIAARLEMPYGLRRAILGFEHDSGVRIGSICLSALNKYQLCFHDAAVRKRGMEILRAAVKLSVNMGINLIQITGCGTAEFGQDFDGVKWFDENLRLAADYAASTGVILALGTGKSHALNTVSKAAGFINSIGMPCLALYPDIGNLINGVEQSSGYGLEGDGKPGGLTELAAADLATGKGHIFAAQLKESRRGVYDGLLFGEGRVDFESIVSVLAELGVRRLTAVQRYTDDRAGYWEEDLLRASEYIRGAWSKRKASAALRTHGE